MCFPSFPLLLCLVDPVWHCDNLEAHSQAEAMKCGPQHKFGNFTLFSPKIVLMT